MILVDVGNSVGVLVGFDVIGICDGMLEVGNLLGIIVGRDVDGIIDSVKRTNRVLILHEDNITGGIGAEVSALINESAFEYLDAPIERLGSIDTPTPFNQKLEQDIFWPKLKIMTTIKKIIEY